MLHVNYARGDGGLIITADQLDELSVLTSELRGIVDSNNRDQLGAGVPVYEALLGWISDEEPTGTGTGQGGNGTRLEPNPGVDSAVWRWIEGATKVNSGEGFFTDFIREYTKIQFRVRGGDPALAESRNQEASNRIALNLANDILANEGSLPDISGLGAIDAGAAASTVF